jgi:hypothetical protein
MRLKIFFSFITPDERFGEIAKSVCVLRALIQQHKERSRCRRPRERGKINGSGVLRRSVGENVRGKKKPLNPNRVQQADF